MYVTPEQAQQILFTDPKHQMHDTLLVARGNPRGLNSYESMACNSSAKLAVMAGTEQYVHARRWHTGAQASTA